MEHEDNAHLDNFLQNSQNLMENLQMASGGGICGDVAAEEIGGIGSSIGGKFEEHEEHGDEEEWKYIKEVHQSEKQQTMKAAADVDGCGDGEIVGKEGIGNGVAGNSEELLLAQHHEEVGNGVVDVDAGIGLGIDAKVVVGSAVDGAVVLDEEGDVEIIKNDGDFSTTSNTTSTPCDDEMIAGDDGILQVQMKIETNPLLQQTELHQQQQIADELEEEDISSLTTNGTSSLSENPNNPLQQQPEPELLLQQQQHQQLEEHQELSPQQDFDPFSVDLENKENADPHGAEDTVTRPSDFDFELHSQLNPDACEFVPSFGSNPASPTAPVSDIDATAAFEAVCENVGEPADSQLLQQQPHPYSVPHHLLGTGIGDDDDFVAGSPRKGRAANMDSIVLPAVNDFEHEAAQRPHELEQEGDLIGISAQQLPLEQKLESCNGSNNANAGEAIVDECLDFKGQSASSFIDHGPETSVDLDVDVDMTATEDIMNRSLYEEKDKPIEDVLNSVQPLPVDVENLSTFTGDEEVQVDQHIENKNTLPGSLDMQESFYMEHTSSDAQKSPLITTDESLLINTTNPLEDSSSTGHNVDISFETMRAATYSGAEDDVILSPTTGLNIMAPEFMPEQKLPDEDDDDALGSPSPHSTEEKHLVEETKEQLIAGDQIDELEQKMNELLMTSDGNLSQVEEVVEPATIITDVSNPFFTQESEQKPLEPTPIEESFSSHEQSTEQYLQQQVFSQESEQKVLEPTPIEEPFSLHEQFTQQYSQQQVDQQLQPEVLQFEQNYVNEEQQEQQQHHQQQQEEPQQFHDDFMLQTEKESYPSEKDFEPQPEPEQQPAVNNVAFEEPLAVSCDRMETVVSPEPVAPAVEVMESPIASPIQEAAPLESPKPDSIAAETVESPIASPIQEASLLASPKSDIVQAFEPAIEEKPTEVIKPVEGEQVTPAEEAVEVKPLVEEVAAPVAAIAVGAVAATAAVAATIAAVKKTEVAKKPTGRTSLTGKPKVGDAKKPVDIKKSPAVAAKTTTASAARPRTAPTKPSTGLGIEKKSTVGVASKLTTAPKKPLTSTTGTSTTKTAPRTIASSTARPATAPTASKVGVASRTTTSRTSTTTTGVRKAPTTSTATANGVAAKPRLTTSSATKPTTLGISSTAAAKPKLSSPRSTFSSQLRKGTGTTPTSTGAKSPSKPIAPTTNGVHSARTATTTNTSRTKTATGSTTTTTTTRTFTARPAPKTTSTVTLTSTTTRRTTGSIPLTTASKTTSTTLKKTSPSKPIGTGTGRPLSSPTKPATTNSISKAKTKETPKKATPLKGGENALKSSEKQTDQLNPKANGDATLEPTNEAQLQLNGAGEVLKQNGTHEEISTHNGGGGDEGHDLLLGEQKALIDA